MDSDVEEEENFISYGTPLVKDVAELEEAPRKKPVPVEHQIATDEKGRRRFHGAFTGGFSAGYFNSVGTKEGWAPTNFLSSRSSRADKKNQNPEDFMDDEDLGAFGIAPRAIHVQKDFNDEPKEDNRKRPYESLFNKKSIPGTPPLKDFVIPSRESAGVKLLKKMGWRPGQGIGPRIAYKEKYIHKPKKTVETEPGVKVYGCSLPEDFQQPDDSDSDDFELYEGLTFAPDDVQIQYFNSPKENWNGLGYVGLDKNPILNKKSSQIIAPVVDKGKKLAIAGEAFGVGAFERDDDTIYNNDDLSQYDFELYSGADDKVEEKKDWKRNANIGYIGKELEGFHISTEPLSSKKYYLAPTLPKDFQPIRKIAKPTGFIVEEMTAEAGHSKQQLSSLSRGAAIGELNQKASVFDYLKPEDKARLQNIKKSIHSDAKSDLQSSSGPCAASVSNAASVTKLSDLQPTSKLKAGAKTEAPKPLPEIKKSSSGTFMPFANDQEKQKRYDLFLHFRKNKCEADIIQYQPATLTEWEKQRELEEFYRASELFKPLAHSMASRFVSSKQTTEAESSREEAAPPEGLSTPIVTLEIKREKFEWHPDPVLCKRFNIPNPYPDSKLIGVPKTGKKDKFSIYDLFSIPEKDDTSKEDISAIPSPKKNDEPEIIKQAPEVPKKASLFDGLDEKPIPKFIIPPVTETIVESRDESIEDDTEDIPKERPPIDLFKAIFDDSDDDNDEESVIAQKTITGDESTKAFSLADIIPKEMIPSSSETSTSLTSKIERKASGLFANLDLPPPQRASHSNDTDRTKRLTSIAVQLTDTNSPASTSCYGPALPPRLQTSDTSKITQSSKTVEKDKRHRKKNKKEKHRSKKHKHRRKSSEDESESEDEINAVKIKMMDKKISHKLRDLLKVKR